MLIRDLFTRSAGLALTASLVLLLSVLASPARAQPESASVQAVRSALMELVPSSPTDPKVLAKGLEDRKEKLRQLTDDDSKLQDLEDIAQTLLLPSWWPDSVAGAPPNLTVDRDAYKALMARFLRKLDRTIKGAEKAPDIRAAVVTLVGEFAASARSLLSSQRGNKVLIDGMPSFTKVAAGLAEKDGSPEVRAAAARALTKTQSDPKVTMAALNAMLKARDPVVRRAAALALTDLLRGTQSADRGGFTAAPPVQPSSENLPDFGPPVAKAAGDVLKGNEPDAEVRRLCAAALVQVGSILKVKLTLRGISSDTPHEKLGSVVTALWDQSSALERATADADPRVRNVAIHALEEMGTVRLNWLSPPVESLLRPPTIEGKPRGGSVKPPRLTSAREEMTVLTLSYVVAQAPPVKAKDEPPPLASAVPALVARLRTDNVRNRLAAVDALEMIISRPPSSDRTVAQDLGPGPAAAVAAALTRALSDPDRFVRWASARTLGEMAPLTNVENAESVERGAVAGLARLLLDTDPDVRMRSAIALGLFGKAAERAVPFLARAVTNRGDLEARISAAHAIQAIGGHAAEAVPALADNLSDPNVRMRRSAAEALSSYGAAAAAAKPALNRALFDSDPEVRRIASGALLKIRTGR